MSTLNTVNITNGTDSITVEGAVKGSAKAWVNFNGTGTVAIRASYNVSSITDNGVGNYTVNFTTAMADTNYAVVSTAGRTYTSSNSGRACDINRVNTSNFSITVFEAATYALDDVVGVLASVFR